MRGSAALAGYALLGGAPAARPAVAHGVTTLFLAMDWEGLESAYQDVPQIMPEVFAAFEAEHPGVRVSAVAGGCSNGNALPQSAIPAQIVAGAGPDVFSLCYDFAAYVDGGLVLPLDAYLRRDNVPLATWPANTLEAMTFGAHIYFLPAEEQPHVIAVNRGLLNQLGLRVPGPEWTYSEAADLWRAVSGPVGKNRRYGLVSSDCQPGDIHGWTWLLNGFGGSPQNAAYTRSTFAAPACVQAGEWVAGLTREKVLTGGDLYGNAPMFLSGQAAFIDAPSWAVPLAAQQLRGMDWVFLPFPIFPAGRSTMNQGNAYAISATTRYPELAWALLKWICVDPEYWRKEVRVSLNTPAQTALWPEWVSAVESIAPGLKGKGLEWYTEAQLQNYGRPGHPFKYDEPACQSIIGNWSGKIFAGSMSVAEAFARIDAQVNTVERIGESLEAGAAAGLARVKAALAAAASGPAGATFPPPARGGAGSPYTPATGMVRVQRGVYTLRGGGQGLSSYNDDALFAAAPSTAVHASFTCRVTSLARGSCSQLDPNAQVGLMARGDLSDDAPVAVISVSAGGGVVFTYRAVTLGDTNQVTLLPPSGLFRTGVTGQGNNLARPVWLRLTRAVGRWTPAVSLDGKTWQSGAPAAVEAAGVWVGLFATSNEADFSAPCRVTAVVDSLAGFAPTVFVQLGGP